MKNYTLSLTTKTLTITKAFEDAVATGEGVEYETYMKFMRDIPGLTVIRKTHKTPATYTSSSSKEKFRCNQFKNLTYKNMEKFIEALPNSDELMVPYKFLKEHGSLPQTSRYTAVRRWFVAQFPKFRKNPLFYLYNKVSPINSVPFAEQVEEEAEEKALAKAS